MLRAKPQESTRGLLSDPIIGAFAISVLVHVGAVFGLELGRAAGLWERSLLPEWIRPHPTTQTAQATQKQLQRQQPVEPPEAELVFVDVDPAQAVAEPPKNAKYYSAQNTVAASTAEGQSPTPKIDGKQDKIPKTRDTTRPDPNQLHPLPQPQTKPPEKAMAEEAPARVQPPETKAAPVKEQEKPKNPAEKQGETLLAKANIRPEPQQESNPSPPQTQPRRHAKTLAEAKANKGVIEGQKMRQEGGSRRFSIEPGLDVKATPFGAYDTAFIMAVQARWFSLLEDRQFVGNEAGKVVVEFRLHQDGRITNLRIIDSEVSQILSWFCQRAVQDPSPYRPFPSDLRRMMNNEYREIRFTFYYNQ